ncbi:MAG: hypothetical protein QOJ02_1185 [Acidobacteriota bacterium]|nr:hypothetical protein [Acidobacteriota bacterium]
MSVLNDPVYGFEEREGDDPKTFPRTLTEIILRFRLSIYRFHDRVRAGVAVVFSSAFEHSSSYTNAVGAQQCVGEADIETCE